MTTWFVNRHSGAVEWFASRGMAVDHVVDHIDPAVISAGDVVIGSLPVHLAAEICARGGRYFHLVLNVPPDKRGAELTPREMDEYGARVREFRVWPADEGGGPPPKTETRT